MHKIGVIGDMDSIQGFKTLGFQVFPAGSSQEAEAQLKKLVHEGYALIYITEQAAADIHDTIEEYKDSLLPAIILIPGIKGSLGIGMRAIRTRIERAVGADILFGDK